MDSSRTHKIQTPDAEVFIDEDLIVRLLEDQIPEYKHFKIQKLDEGWDNVSYRLGEEFLIRIPRREASANLALIENKYLPEIQARINLDIPVPIKLGFPTDYYPWHWTIVPYFSGSTVNKDTLVPGQVHVMSKFLRSLHTPAPVDTPPNQSRASLLNDKTELVMSNLEYIKSHTQYYFTELDQLWQNGLKSSGSIEKKWIHGDLHARNIVSSKGEIIAIIDWGDLTAGDPATDLACFWQIFENPEIIMVGLREYGVNPDLLNRAKAWAVFFGSVLVVNGISDNPAHKEMGIKTLKTIQNCLPVF